MARKEEEIDWSEETSDAEIDTEGPSPCCRAIGKGSSDQGSKAVEIGGWRMGFNLLTGRERDHSSLRML